MSETQTQMVFAWSCNAAHYQLPWSHSYVNFSHSALRDMFGEECVDFRDEKNISVTIDGKTIDICLETRVRRNTLSTLA